jgi:hypothetical protein
MNLNLYTRDQAVKEKNALYILFRNVCLLEICGKYSNKTMADSWIRLEDYISETTVSDLKPKSNYSLII